MTASSRRDIGFALRATALRLILRLAMPLSFLSVAFSSLRLAASSLRNVGTAEQLRPGDQSAVAGDLVMLDGLRGRDQCGIENHLVGDFAGDVVGLVDDAVDRRAFGALRLKLELLKA